MKVNRKEIKREARESMRAHRPSVYLVALVFLILIWVLDSLSFKLLHPGQSAQDIVDSYIARQEAVQDALENGDITGFVIEYEQTEPEPATGARLIDLAISIMNIMITAGFVLFCLNVSRNAEAGFGNLFDTFGIFFRVLWLHIVMGFFIFLWSLLLVVPGIIAGYRYSQALYVLLDDPSKGALECIRESKEMMRGHKWQLFVLQLSFIGWAILSIIPFVGIYTEPYFRTTYANFYRAVSGREYCII